MIRQLALLLALAGSLNLGGVSGPAAPAEGPAVSGESAWEAPAGADWGITMSLRDVTAAGATLVIVQDGGTATGQLQTGSDYRILTLEDGAWKELPVLVDNAAWTAEAYGIRPGATLEQTLHWEGLYGVLPAGHYGICKSVQDFRGPGDYDEAVFWVEFTLS